MKVHKFVYAEQLTHFTLSHDIAFSYWLTAKNYICKPDIEDTISCYIDRVFALKGKMDTGQLMSSAITEVTLYWCGASNAIIHNILIKCQGGIQA